MLPEKILMNSNIRQTIKNARISKDITLTKLANSINKTTSYLSALEKGRIKSISKKDLITILKQLFDLNSDEKAESKINEIITLDNPSSDVIADNAQQVNLFDFDSNHPIQKYNPFQKKDIKTQINFVSEIFKKILETVYQDDPETVVDILRILPQNFMYDTGFILAILEAPFFAFKKLNHDERQAYLNEFADLFNKYALLAKNRDDNSKDKAEAQQDKPSNTESNPNDSGD
ncbi:MAG TPA: hypothetical protein DC024_10425 [Clostridiales bacterium]|jgi:transcriptional regulator with XRE-family HTH domain|nr:hypothetical protein [Clostridiales bacterium]